ncbi:hypothetical protein I5523_08185 [Acinetobacter oleivorans]|uniref:tryptophan 2,3-dioxygenase family protein n=1 Tax=Acinetobacter oleivorans TaxID=1148157 RepID=UPI0018FFA276|nr:tryptophan 2,3-dioxygenase family protein [Acinetobacter oleivorans]MBJ9739619.1 hypothetical protein [Acinetobacter oleivorans]MCU4411981.1 tryptophan 2,3-dioxygenase [Acinetobacter oleivorans]
MKVYYSEYLQLDKVLTAQQPVSCKLGECMHDEHFFIVLHQTHELWFKQIIYELESINKLFITHRHPLAVALPRMRRVFEIMKAILPELKLLETLSQEQFFQFRDFIAPASGSQSYQFKMIELILGLRNLDEELSNTDHLNEKQLTLLVSTGANLSLQKQTDLYLKEFYSTYNNNFFLERLPSYLKHLHDCGAIFEVLGSDIKDYQDAFIVDGEYEFGEAKFDKISLQSALICLYACENKNLEPLNHIYDFIFLISEIESVFKSWKEIHAMVVRNILGFKSGTGGTTGYLYLKDRINKLSGSAFAKIIYQHDLLIKI